MRNYRGEIDRLKQRIPDDEEWPVVVTMKDEPLQWNELPRFPIDVYDPATSWVDGDLCSGGEFYKFNHEKFLAYRYLAWQWAEARKAEWEEENPGKQGIFVLAGETVLSDEHMDKYMKRLAEWGKFDMDLYRQYLEEARDYGAEHGYDLAWFEKEINSV
jgi:hypothetical protein